MDDRVGLLRVGMPLARHVARVSVDGAYVPTDQCFAGDDRQGWLVILKRDAAGRYHLDERGSVAVQLLTGDVRFTFSE